MYFGILKRNYSPYKLDILRWVAKFHTVGQVFVNFHLSVSTAVWIYWSIYCWSKTWLQIITTKKVICHCTCKSKCILSFLYKFECQLTPSPPIDSFMECVDQNKNIVKVIRLSEPENLSLTVSTELCIPSKDLMALWPKILQSLMTASGTPFSRLL